MMRGAALVVLAGLLAAACSTTDVPIPDCSNPAEPAAMVQYSPTILVIEIIETRDGGIEATAIVREKWRGVTLPDEIVIRGDGDPDQPVRRYASGVDYLLFSDEVFSPLPDHGCSATRVFTEELAELRPERAITYGVVRDANLTPWFVGAALVSLAAVAILAVRSRRERLASGSGEWNPDYEIRRDEDEA